MNIIAQDNLALNLFIHQFFVKFTKLLICVRFHQELYLLEIDLKYQTKELNSVLFKKIV